MSPLPPRLLLAVCCWLPTLALRAQPVDVPTWRVGDTWAVREELRAAFATETGTTELAGQADFLLRLGAIVERTSDWAGAHRCYVRQRQQGAVVGTGMTRLGTLDVTIHINNGQVTGETWNRVGDLALVRETITLAGELRADFLQLRNVLLGTMTYSMQMEFNPPLEMMDFPMATIGETWQVATELRQSGRLTIDFVDNLFGLEDVDDPFEVILSREGTARLLGLETRGGRLNTRHVQAAGVFEAWWSPALAEAVEYQLAPVAFEGGGLNEYTRSVLSASLQQSTAIGEPTFTPARPARGQPFTVEGTAPASSAVTARLAGAQATVNSNGAGRYSLTLPSPSTDDATPASDDVGSFGVEITSGLARRVKTVQLQMPQTSAGGWTAYR
ncbi:MAG TPA: hypothetical protein PK847_06210 [Candidatus Sumerlaeota bacterium]|nr:hypothetical protein [Candidatus Sumerlaeota bacterium]HOR28037.1 hypothetical protein [Candidatus Sumerlaeota bacterium]